MPGTPARSRSGEVFETVLQRRLRRRAFLRGSAAVGAAMTIATPAFLAASRSEAQVADALSFTPIEGSDANGWVPAVG